MKIGILVAMDNEFKSLMAADLDCPGKKLIVGQTGIGKVNAAIGATKMILNEKPDCIINTGMAGGMLLGMKVSDFVIATHSAYHDVWCGEGNEPGQVQGLPRLFPADPHLLQVALEQARGYDHPVQSGLVCSGDQFFISMEEDDRIRALYPNVIAADMESTSIAQVCHQFNVPFLNFRIISDIHTSSQVQKDTYASFSASMDGTCFRFLKQFIQNI